MSDAKATPNQTFPSDRAQSFPRASIIVCVFRRPEITIRCLEALLRQDYPNYEIIAIDDASGDETPELLARFIAEHAGSRVRLLASEENCGVSASRNKGIAAATGEIVAFIAPDCIAPPHWLANITAPFADPSIGAVSGAVYDQVPTTWAERAAAGRSRVDAHPLRVRKLAGNNMAFRREILLAHPFDDNFRLYCDEDELATRLLQAGVRFAIAPNASVEHRHPLTTRQFLRQAWVHGQGAAQLWYKHRTFIGRDLIFLFLAVVTVPLCLVSVHCTCLTLVFLLLHALAHLYNEHFLKGKSWGVTLYVLPAAVLYSMIKLAGVLYFWLFKPKSPFWSPVRGEALEAKPHRS